MIDNNPDSNRFENEISFYSFETKEEWISETLQFFSKMIQEKISLPSDSPFHIILSGGNTPLPIYRRFSTLELPWQRIHFWLADERCVSKNDPDRSETEIKKALGDSILKSAIFHSLPEGDPTYVANYFEEQVKSISNYTISFLGIGEDGHIASLFPGFDIGESDSSPNILPVYNSPKLPVNRVSLSLQCINRSEHVIFLVTGPSKKKIVDQVIEGKNLPATKVKGRKSSQIFFCME
ncbi:6-phosphogluconolactonase [Leptospira biflexa]|uniref:6-phosphogluconolactonase n=1 Tax=Leptospira biflexa TaxID=172 RepID=UPI0010830350|nr:6-phosphogluconolactonase [Leptospira biflexa]TGM31726.1 6-phosphogluconolactonase [Leptospira biflexa]TGM39115.1 6-phosphogluconolactonase [Leptospira biflexa]